MPVLNFKKEFAPLVELGLNEPDHPHAKRQTIRAPRKDGRDPKPGDRLYLYTGMRTVACRKLGESECKYKDPIAIEGFSSVVVGTKVLSFEEEKKLARADGFPSACEFLSFFEKTHGFPFYGFLYKW